MARRRRADTRAVLILVSLGVAALAGVAPQATALPAETGQDTQAQPSTGPEEASMEEQSRFELHIFEGTRMASGLGYDFEPAWKVLRRLDPSSSAFTLQERDVEAYDWKRQILTINRSASQAIVRRLAETEEQREHPETALDLHVFLVRLGGHPVYGGIFLFPMSAMGIDYPVIHVSSEEGRLAFTVRPIHRVTGDYSQYEPEWYGIKDPRIREVFEAVGVLTP